MINPWLAIVLVLLSLAAVMVGVRLLAGRLGLAAELQRKVVHIAMGLVTLGFPWLFAEAWPVVLLAVLAVTAMAGLRSIGPLRKMFGKVLHGVARNSLGEMYFPLAVALLFVLAGDEPVLYVAPLLVLSLADAVAALIGVRFGRHRYATSEGSKSAEGSLSFLAAAFLSVCLPMLLMTDEPMIKIALGSLLIGILVMLFEGISVGGLDNLFIPVGCYGLLAQYRTMDAADLFYRLLALCLLALAVYCWRRRTTLIGSALLAAVLVGYMNWMLGGWPWLAVSLILFFTYTWLWPKNEINSSPIHSVRSIAAVAAPGMVWLVAAARNPDYRLLYPFILSYGAHSVIIGMLQLGYTRARQSIWQRGAVAVVGSWLVFFPAFFFPHLSVGTAPPLDTTFIALVAGLPLLALAALLYQVFGRYLGQEADGRLRWYGYALIALTVAAGGEVLWWWR